MKSFNIGGGDVKRSSPSIKFEENFQPSIRAKTNPALAGNSENRSRRISRYYLHVKLNVYRLKVLFLIVLSYC